MKLRESIPELTGASKWLNGEVSTEELVGMVPTLLHFWSISCHLCKEVMPQVNEIRDKYNEKLNIVAVHMPRSAEDIDIAKIKQTASEHGITQPIYVDSNDILTTRFENQYVPAYYLFDKDGKLRHFQAGKSGMNMLEKRIKRLLDEQGKKKEC